MATVEALPSRIRAKIAFNPCPIASLDGPCWIWTAARFEKRGSYGAVGYQRKIWSAHRLTYTLLIGEIPQGLELDHLCRVRPCCNPAHVEPVTHEVNLARGLVGHRINGHCGRGHELTPDNVLVRANRGPRGVWECRTCINITRRARRARALKSTGIPDPGRASKAVAIVAGA